MRRRARAGRLAAIRRVWTATHPIPLISHVQIQTQSRCNADCVFCPYVESWHAQHPGRMSDALFERILEHLEPFEVGIRAGEVVPYLMQEPLLDVKLFDRIRLVQERFPGTSIGLSTNGIPLTDRAIDGLLDVLAGTPHHIEISHHGVDADTLWHVMRIDHDKAVANILRLVERAAGRLNLTIRGAGTSVDGRVRHFYAQAFERHWWRTFHEAGVFPTNVRLESFRFHARAGTIHRDDRQASQVDPGVVRTIDAAHPFSCRRVTEWAHVMYDGTLRLCCMDYHGEIALPSLAEISLEAYLHSQAHARIAARVRGERVEGHGWLCERCQVPER